MAKVMTVAEAIASMTAKKNSKGEYVTAKFNKKNFNNLMVALANDVDFKSECAKVKKGELEIEEIMVTAEFRKWCKKLIEKAGIDKAESVKVLSSDFVIDDMTGLYEFFAEALYQYINAGNKFDLISKKDMQGSIFMKSVPEVKKVSDAYNPKDRSYLGTFESVKKAHKEVKVKSSCPSYLSEKRKIK